MSVNSTFNNNHAMALGGINSIASLALYSYTFRKVNELQEKIEELEGKINTLKQTQGDTNKAFNATLVKLNKQLIDRNGNSSESYNTRQFPSEYGRRATGSSRSTGRENMNGHSQNSNQAYKTRMEPDEDDYDDISFARNENEDIKKVLDEL